MESIGRLAGGVAHDFNNMLSVIIGQSELALLKKDSSDVVFKAITEIEKAAKRSAELTKQLLSFARKQTVEPQVINLNETISETVSMLKRLIGEDINLNVKMSEDLWQVKIDPMQINQILANLCVNSRDAISGLGEITIETLNVVLHGGEENFYTEVVPGEYVMLSVSDTGCGFSRESLQHIFEPFFTTKSQGKGTGLGLPMIYGIVRQNSGLISLESKEGHGSTFRIYLPRHTGVKEESQKEENFMPAIQSQSILLVEDEPMLLEMTSSMLAELGYFVIEANSPLEAMEIAENYKEPIGLLMTDVIMPEMNGKELAEKIRLLHPNIRILYMSGYTSDIIGTCGMLYEGINFIQKPFNISSLSEKLSVCFYGDEKGNGQHAKEK